MTASRRKPSREMHAADGGAFAADLSPRETEMLEAALRLLEKNGYERLSVEAVASAARASKSTLYRRWPSKADLVVAAVVQSIAHDIAVPETGSLRGDLLEFGEALRSHLVTQGATVRAVLAEASYIAAFDDIVGRHILRPANAVVRHILAAAAGRGEISELSSTRDDLVDILPGYLIFRSVLNERLPSRVTVMVLVDDMLLPALTGDAGTAPAC